MAEFKKISDVDVLTDLTENDNVLVIGSDGALKQTASSNVKGSSSIVFTSENFYEEEFPYDNGGSDWVICCGDNYDELYEALLTGTPVFVNEYDMYTALGWDTNNDRWTPINSVPVTNLGASQVLVGYWILTDRGLILSTWNDNILFPNGSYNPPTIEQPEPPAES